MSSLSQEATHFSQATLHVPPLEELVSLLNTCLSLNFEEVEVKVVECPDLSQAPWSLAGSGLGGSPKLLDIGGELNLFYAKNNGAIFDFDECARLSGVPNAFMIGPGAGARPVVGVNCELMANVNVGTGKYLSHIAKMKDEHTPIQEHYPSKKVGILCNLLACEGKTGGVLYVRAANRKGPLNFVSCMKNGLKEKYTKDGHTVGIGGAFQMTKGAVHAHVMPDFPNCDMTPADCSKWLKFFEFHGPITCLSVFVSNDIDNMNLRLEHTHFFSDHGEGGHYHDDTTPNEVEYIGYFVPCEQVCKIGKPIAAPSNV